MIRRRSINHSDTMKNTKQLPDTMKDGDADLKVERGPDDSHHNVAVVTKSSTKALARAFCEDTTAHGFGSFIREKVVGGRVCWMVIIVGALAANAWHLSLVVTTYLQYSTQEIVSISHEAPTFPDVTFCNLQARSRSRWAAAQDSEVVQTYLATIDKIKVAAADRGIDWESVDDRALAPVSFLENTEFSRAELVGHSLDDFVMGCSFAGADCNTEDFTHHIDGTYYNCYTFRRNLTVANETGSVGAGPRNALSLILYLEALSPTANSGVPQLIYNGNSPVENSVGARVVIKQQGGLAEAVLTGLDVNPGHSTSFALTTEYLKRLHKPYGECSSNATLFGMDQYTYTTFGCLYLCTQRYIWDNCGCISASLPVPDNLIGEIYCGKYLEDSPSEYFKRTACETTKWHEFDSSGVLRQDCTCYQPCKRFSYAVVASESKWPGDQYIQDFYKDLVSTTDTKASEQLAGISPTNTTGFGDLMRANFARVNVYFKDLDVEWRVQEASYVMSSLWSTVGGTIGLWAGLSAITLVECVVFLVKLVISPCHPPQVKK